ncbi:MAG: hypothetical protein NTV54_12830 [Ignavibacteriales bacterium]|nr:hypothetical protein [Ignavibacteriales bacterium]
MSTLQRIALLWCVAVVSVYARVGDWKNYTDMRQVRALAGIGETVWAATGGGIFRFSLRDSSFLSLTNGDGLSSNNVTAIAIDGAANVWIGHASGAIDVFSSSLNTWRHVTDIVSSPKVNKSIRKFFFAGDSLYIASAFGVSLFSISRFEFKETYENLGSLNQSTVIGAVEINGRVFVSTTGGVAISKPSATNLSSPDAWDTFALFSTPGGLAVFRGSVYLSSAGGVFQFTGNAWTPVPGLTAASTRLVSTDSMLYVAQLRNLLAMNTAGIVSVVGNILADNLTDVAAAGIRGPVLSLAGSGIAMLKGNPGEWKTTKPNGPASNLFSSMVVDESGMLWCASSRYSGSGFYAFDGKTWTNFSASSHPALITNDFFRVTLGPNNSKWFSSFGSGIVVMDAHMNVARRFDHSDPGFLGVKLPDQPDNLSYVIPGGVARDHNDNMWVALWHSAGQYGLWKMSADSTWTPIRTALADNVYDLVDMTIDNNGTKWISNCFPAGSPSATNALHFYNAERNIGQAADGWGQLGTADGLPSGTVASIAVDREGDLWVGTGSGISIVANPNSPAQGIRRVYVGAVVQEQINVIAVDPLNNKWVATRQGVFVLSPDGTLLLNQYNVRSTGGKLVDDNIIAIQFDGKRGIVYFGSENGLSSLEIPATLPIEKFSGLRIAPNPFIIPDYSTAIISGLVEDSMIKIMTLQGTVVRAFAAQGGGRAFWDGKDDNGRVVGSGVYIVVAHSSSGNDVAMAKMAVLRR